jgi:hypothetical protein
MDFQTFMSDSFVLLYAEIPSLYRRLAGTLGERWIMVEVDGPRFAIASDGFRLSVVDPADSHAVDLATSGREILALLDGRTTLLDSVRAGRLRLRGRPDEIKVFYDALMVYLGAAVRAPGFVSLRDRFRSEVEEGNS